MGFVIPRKILFLTVIIIIFIVPCISATDFNITFLNNGSMISSYGYADASLTNLFFNTSVNAIRLVNTTQNGTMLSQIFNSGSKAQWYNISWLQGACYHCELPDNNVVESQYIHNTNMSGNVLLYHLNEQSGIFIDTSGNGNNGTNNGATYGISGRFNTALSFDGINNNITVPYSDSLFLNETGAVSMFVNFRSLNSGTHWLAVYSAPTYINGWGINQYGSRIYLYIGSKTGGTTGSCNPFVPTTNTWYHLHVQWNNSRTSCYINGTLRSSSSRGPSPMKTNGTLFFGGGSNNWVINGTIDEIALWNRRLTEQEISDIYKRGVLRLNLSVRTCDDLSCEGETFVGIDSTTTYFSNLSLLNNSYFQYNVILATEDIKYSPELYNVTLQYSLIDTSPPSSLMFVSPTRDNNELVSQNWYYINMSFAEENPEVCLLETNENGSKLNYTMTMIENACFVNRTNVPDGTYTYKVYVNDTSSNIGFSEERTITLDTVPPSITSVIPSNDSSFMPLASIEISANVSDINTITSVIANITYPNATNVQLLLTQQGSNKYNETLSIPNLEGQYNITFFANDTANNVNASEKTFFYIRAQHEASSPLIEEELPPAGSITNNFGFVHNPLTLRTGEAVHFEVDREVHQMKVRFIYDDSAVFQFFSKEFSRTLKKGEEAMIDLNDDKHADIYLRLNEIIPDEKVYRRTVKMNMLLLPKEDTQQIKPKAESSTMPPQQTIGENLHINPGEKIGKEIQNKEYQKNVFVKDWLSNFGYIIAGILVIISGFFFLVVLKKK